MYGGQSISWLPRVCSHELLEPSATRREKSLDVIFISISCSICGLQKTLTESQVKVCVHVRSMYRSSTMLPKMELKAFKMEARE